MYTSATAIDSNKSNARLAVAFLGVTAFCGFFSSVYLSLSHGVFSPCMVYLSVIPFVLGVLPYSLLYLLKLKSPSSAAKQLYNWGVISVLLGFLVKGIVDISGYVVTKVSFFGISLNYTVIYFSIGAALFILGVVMYVIPTNKTDRF